MMVGAIQVAIKWLMDKQNSIVQSNLFDQNQERCIRQHAECIEHKHCSSHGGMSRKAYPWREAQGQFLGLVSRQRGQAKVCTVEVTQMFHNWWRLHTP